MHAWHIYTYEVEAQENAEKDAENKKSTRKERKAQENEEKAVYMNHGQTCRRRTPRN